MNLPLRHRRAFASLRCGVAPLRIETGRHCGLAVDERLCQLCQDGSIEDEMHFLINCSSHTHIRDILFNHVLNRDPTFLDLSDTEKFITLMSSTDFIRQAARSCCDMLDNRQALLFA